MSKMLYLIRGLPGSGKSTLAQNLAGVLGCPHYEADMFFMEDGAYTFDRALLLTAHWWCQNMVAQHMMQGIPDVIVSNTFTTEKELKPYLALAQTYGYNVTSLVIENRHGNISVHGVPEETMQKMQDRFSVKLR